MSEALSERKRILMFGASGALGRAISAALQSDEKYALILTSREQRVSAVENIAWLKCDMNNTNDIEAVLLSTHADAVINMAASFLDDYTSAMQVNYYASQTILNWVHAHAQQTVVILAGSAAEYGVVTAADNPIRETQRLQPASIYAHSKACQSMLVELYARKGVDVRYARVFNLDGVGLSTRLFAGRIQQQILEIQSGARDVIETGPLSAVRDYISCENAAEQIVDVLHAGQAGETYHIASGVPQKMRDVLARMLENAGLSGVAVIEADGLSNRHGVDVPLIYADMQKTNSLRQISKMPSRHIG